MNYISFLGKALGKDCVILSAFSESLILNVYKFFEHLSLNFVTPLFFLILIALASFLLV